MKIESPYIGPRPFDSHDQEIFFGRDREAYELALQVVAKKEVVLYSLSGAGKTSLVNAKVCPMLEEEGFEILRPARVQGAIPQFQCSNVFVFHTLMSWVVNGIDAEEVSGLSLLDFLDNHPRAIDKEGTPKPRLMIFDQFEELFTFQPDRWRERQGFFEQVRDALHADPTSRALFVMRADCIGRLDRYAQILPQKFRSRFYLEQLREDSARAAIIGPAEHFGRRFVPGVAEKIVADLIKHQGEFVEPIQLQIVCTNLWSNLPQSSVEITMEHLVCADIGSALLNFYEDALRAAAGEDGAKKITLRHWIEHQLITSAGTRGMVFRGKDETAGLPNEIIDALEKVRLIRSELHSGGRWYELAHDGFIDAIKKSRDKWWAGRGAAKQILDRLEGKAADWVGSGRLDTDLLTGTELLDLVRLRDNPDTFEMEFSSNLRAFLDKSERQQAKGEAERLRELLLLSRLIAQADAHKKDDLDLALLLSLEANRVADVIKQTGRLFGEVADSLVVEAHASLGETLVASPYLLNFLHGHSTTVSSVVFDEKGRFLVTGSHDGTLVLWSAWGYPISSPLVGHKGRVEAVAVSPDSETLASCGEDGMIVLWDVATLKPIGFALDAGQGPLYSVAFSSSGKQLASCGENGTLIMWDVQRRERLGEPFKGHHGAVYHAAFSPDGSVLASCGTDKVIIEWDIEKHVPRLTLTGHKDTVLSLAFSPDGKTLATGSRDAMVVLWDATSGKQIGEPLSLHTNPVYGVAFSPDGKILASCSKDGTVRRWDVASRDPIGEPFAGYSHRVYSIAFRPGSDTMLAAGTSKGTIVLWGVAERPVQLAERVNLGAQIKSIAFSANHRFMAFGMQNDGIAFHDSLERAYKLEHKHTGPVTSIAFSPDSKKLASASLDGTVLVWDTTTRQPIAAPIRDHARPVMSVAFSPDGRTLASGGAEAKVFVRDVAGQVLTGELLAGHKGSVRAVRFSPDGKTLAAGGTDQKVILWDLATKRKAAELEHASGVLCLAFSPDGKILASGTRVGNIVLWDVASRQKLGGLKHKGKVRSVAFSPDGRTLASGSDDKTAMLWDVTTGLALGQLMTERQQEVWSVAFSPDGDTLASGSGELMFWDISFEEMRARAALLAGRNLTEEERKQFLRHEPYDFTSLDAELLEAHRLALGGDTAKAEEAFHKLVPWVIKTRSHTLNNRVGWIGSLDGFAKIVLPACNAAVELVSGREQPYYRRIEAIVRDTRGVARALVGDRAGAIKDFEAVVQWANQKHEEEKTIPEEWIRRRREWIPELKATRNPFDSAVRKALLRDG